MINNSIDTNGCGGDVRFVNSHLPTGLIDKDTMYLTTTDGFTTRKAKGLRDFFCRQIQFIDIAGGNSRSYYRCSYPEYDDDD